MDRNIWNILKRWYMVTYLSPSLSGPTVQTVFHTQVTIHTSGQLSDMISVITHPLVDSNSEIFAKVYNVLNSILATKKKKKKKYSCHHRIYCLMSQDLQRHKIQVKPIENPNLNVQDESTKSLGNEKHQCSTRGTAHRLKSPPLLQSTWILSQHPHFCL